MFSHKRVLITGGTGSWGHELVKQLIGKCRSLTVLARNEANIVAMSRKYPDLNCVVGDVRDYELLKETLQEIDVVFHLAAIKHVPICENQPDQAISINIGGTQNLIKACKELSISDVILISTDKAVEPINTYGISKAMAEKLFLKNGFKVIRAGNVIGTSGSVIPLFKKQVANGNPITLTALSMTRFFMTLEQAIKLVLIAYKEGCAGDIIVLNMPSFRLIDVAKIIGGTDYPIEIIGIRAGEKIHEVLVSSAELPHTYYMPVKNLFCITESSLPPDHIGVKGTVSSESVTTDLDVLRNML